MYLPCRTSLTPSKPRLLRACSMALPCGSSTPAFSVILMFAFTIPSLGIRPSGPMTAAPAQVTGTVLDPERVWRPLIRFGADQHRPAPSRPGASRQDAEPPRYL